MNKNPPTCKGKVAHGTGCGICQSCEREKESLRDASPVSLLVDERILKVWESAVEDPQHLEIIRLAKVGLASERHSQAIEDALSGMLARLPIAQVSRFERALDSLRRVKARA